MPHTAVSYHRATGYERDAMTPHSLDWNNQPAPYKTYPELSSVALPEPRDLYSLSLLDACRYAGREHSGSIFGINDLTRILMLACGLTARARHPEKDFYFRSAPSAGALYPNELYLVWPGSSELSAGLYHFGVHNRRLTYLRTANSAVPRKPGVEGHPAPTLPLFIVSGIFFRSAWKYRSRAYRYILLDAGHLFENLCLAVSAAGFCAEPGLCFDDGQLNQFLGVDPKREGALGWISLGGTSVGTDISLWFGAAELPAKVSNASRVAGKEAYYEDILDIHRSGCASSGPSDSQCPGKHRETVDPIACSEVKPSLWEPLASVAHPDQIAKAPVMNYAEAVIRRRSRRSFAKQPLKREQFAYLLELLCRSGTEPANSPVQYGQGVVCGCLVGSVENVPPGFYLLDRKNRRFGCVFKGDHRREMAAVCLNQRWLSDAAVQLVFLGDLAGVDQVRGARGYRYAMITAGRLGHAVYLGATALGLGCCGIGAFYDEEARGLLGLNPGCAMLYMAAVGVVKKTG